MSASGADRAFLDTQQDGGLMSLAATSFLATVEQVTNQVAIEVMSAAELGKTDALAI
jgi:hypothetical protein